MNVAEWNGIVLPSNRPQWMGVQWKKWLKLGLRAIAETNVTCWVGSVMIANCDVLCTF